jgi:hypothetical protein
MSQQWIDAVRRRGSLQVFASRGLKSSVWGSLFTQVLAEFNTLARRHSLGVTVAASTEAPVDGTEGGADVAMDIADGTVSFRFAGESVSESFSGRSMHGATYQFSRDGKIFKSFVFVPSNPLINTPRGQRPVGPAVLKLIGLHELVHACGLDNSDHSRDDLFQAMPSVDPGSAASGDRVRIQDARGMRWMPPIVMSPTTANKIKALW